MAVAAVGTPAARQRSDSEQRADAGRRPESQQRADAQLDSGSQRDSDSRRRPGALLVLVCLAQLMVILDVSIVNVALPSIRDGLRFSTTGLQWVVNAYTLTFAGFLLLGGRAADLLGRRRVYLFGLSLFTLASLVGGFAQSPAWLTAARAAQGVGGAFLSPATLTI